MTLKEGQSITRPPLLEGSNYATWKSVMRSFLKSLDEKAWKAVLKGWTEPIMNNLTGEPIAKPEALWTEEEDKASMGNSKAMNTIFSVVDENVMKLIINCEVAKEAWDILQTAFEGTDKVRNSRMQAVTTRFEEMKMKESETITEYNTRVLELSNEASALGKPIDEERLASKVLRSLPPRFAMKVTTIEEMHDITTLKLDELMGSLRTYEINHDFQTGEEKGIALKADITEDKLDSECTTEQLAMMAQNFGRMVRKINRDGSEQGQSSSTGYRNWKSSRPRSTDSRQELSDKGKEEIQCHMPIRPSDVRRSAWNGPLIRKICATCRCVDNSIPYNSLVQTESIRDRLDGQINSQSRDLVGTAFRRDISSTLMSQGNMVANVKAKRGRYCQHASPKLGN
ncbi:unnamed protein product [Rhodiola kirilowii]